MAVDQPLSPPANLFSAGEEGEPDLEIEIVNPEAVSIGTEDGGMIIDFDPEVVPEGAAPHDANLAEYIDDILKGEVQIFGQVRHMSTKSAHLNFLVFIQCFFKNIKLLF